MTGEVNTKTIAELRQRTGAGIVACKNALIKSAGDIEKATEFLREQGLSKAPKSGRVTAEGVVSIAVSGDGKSAAIIHLASETDFVGRNDKFQNLANGLSSLLLGQGREISSEEFLTMKNDSGMTVEDWIRSEAVIIGESVGLGSIGYMAVQNGVIGSYTHNAYSANCGRIGVIVGIETAAAVAGDKLEAVKVFGKQVAMHIAASAPRVTERSELSAEFVEKERDIARTQSESSGKPAGVIEKLIEGRLNKVIEEVTLLEQPFVLNNTIKVGQAVKEKAGELGLDIKITSFLRMAVGSRQ